MPPEQRDRNIPVASATYSPVIWESESDMFPLHHCPAAGSFTLGLAGTLLICAVLLMAYPAFRASAKAPDGKGRTIHVSQKTLPGIPEDLQCETVGDAADVAEPGDTVLIHTGVYRESVSLTTSGTSQKPITFAAAPAATVIITGAAKVTGLKKAPNSEGDNIFCADWPMVGLLTAKAPHPDDDFHKTIGRTEQVFVQGYQLRQVMSREQMVRGTFMLDPAEEKLYVWNNDNSPDLDKDWMQVEASVMPVLWDCQASYINMKGLRFRYACNQAQQGAVIFRDGSHCTVEDCVFEQMNSSGAAFCSPDMVVRRCTFQDNGQLGFGANGAHRLLFTDCLVRNNNTKGFNRGWEAGGDKIVLSRGVAIRNSRFIDNRGAGIWFDIGNEHCTVSNCLIAGNENAGIFYEISYALNASDNVIVGNGLADSSPGSWGANAGIVVSSSPGCIIERNLLVGNKEGFNFREQGRTTPRIGDPGGQEVDVRNRDEVIRNNVIAYNRDVQTWGWFDMSDNSYLPKAMKGAAAGACLEDLNIVMKDNIYALADRQGLFGWGATWRKNVQCRKPEDIAQKLGMEQGSILASVAFEDYASLDLRMAKGSPGFKADCYPKGAVPEVRLGQSEK